MTGMDEQVTNPVPKRRWFRFSLRTLFVMMTVVCCWLGYELNWIRNRHAFIDRQRARLAEFYSGEDLAFYNEQLYYDNPNGGAPSFLWLFGEPALGNLNLVMTIDDPYAHGAGEAETKIWREWQATDPEYREARQLFPEGSFGFFYPRKAR